MNDWCMREKVFKMEENELEYYLKGLKSCTPKIFFLFKKIFKSSHYRVKRKKTDKFTRKRCLIKLKI